MAETRGFFGEQRKRLKRPPGLVVIGIILLLFPIINYLQIAWHSGLDARYPLFVFKSMDVFQYLLLLLPIVVGVGLLIVTKWGYWAFLVYASFLIVYNLVYFFIESTIYNLNAVLQSFFGAIAVIVLTSKDISAPYLKAYPRGWRMQLRRPVKMNVSVDGVRKKTADISERGLYVKWQRCQLEPGAAVELNFKVNGNPYELSAGVVRLDDAGVGIAFRSLDKQTRRQLRWDLQQLEKTQQ